MTDNFKQIRNLLKWDIEDTFYYIQILRRKKENPEAKSVKVIDNVYVKSLEYFDRKEDYIKDMCNYFNARAYIRLNRRSFEDVALLSLEQNAKLIRSKQYEAVMNSFSKACGRTNCEPNRIWIIDIDDGDGVNYKLVKSLIEKLHQEIQDDYKVIDVINTKNGQHIITNPFNVQSFKYTFPNVDIHKDNPTLLYSI